MRKNCLDLKVRQPKKLCPKTITVAPYFGRSCTSWSLKFDTPKRGQTFDYLEQGIGLRFKYGDSNIKVDTTTCVNLLAIHFPNKTGLHPKYINTISRKIMVPK